MMKRLLFISILAFALSACIEEEKPPFVLEEVSNSSPSDLFFSHYSVDPHHFFSEEYFIEAGPNPAELMMRSVDAYALSILSYDGKESNEYANEECAFKATIVDSSTVKIHFSKLPKNEERFSYPTNGFYITGYTHTGKERVSICISRYFFE